MPLDRRREWYRYHHLFRELLATELRRREPEIVALLHLRAAEWCEANGMPESALEHAQAAGEADRVCRLTLTNANRVWASGRATTVLRWMQWFEEHGLVEGYPGIAVHGALMFALMGEPGATERWAAAAELRLLPLLSTHLTLPEIGARLFISRHTVKTQAISVYRKLGVSSRSEAITRMRELGLLAHA